MFKATQTIKNFLRLEASGGIVLFITLVIALCLANSPLASHYHAILEMPLQTGINQWTFNKPLITLINDGLMTLFFMLLALEIKREIIAGQLSEFSQVILPCAAALGGIVVPAIIFFALNFHDANALAGWAIPTATDVALAIGVVTLLNKRVPVSLKIFLIVLAIVDDIAAIIIIAIFYTHELAYWSLAIAGLGILVMLLMNYLNITRIAAYMLLGFIVWLAVLKSGVHATLAGVAVGFCVPFKTENSSISPLTRLEQALHPWIAFIILPLFVLVNADVSFRNIHLVNLIQPVPLGIMLGLFLGKQIGIFGFSWLVIKLKWAQLPKQASWSQLYGIALLAGIGFTMSLFISGLAYAGSIYEVSSKVGILAGSLISALAGTLILWLAKTKS